MQILAFGRIIIKESKLAEEICTAFLMASLFSKVRTALVQLNKKEINVNEELHGAFTVSQFIQVKIYSGGSFRNF